jgi:hypothetical protein
VVVWGGAVAVFEPEEAVCAVKDAGSLIGLVGERGFGFTKPVCGGDGGIFVFTAAPCVVLVVGLFVALVISLAGTAALVSCFSTFFSAGFADSFARPLGVVGVFGAAGDLVDFGDGFDAEAVLVVEIGAGRAVCLLEDGLSIIFSEVAGLPLFVCPFEAALLAAAFLRPIFSAKGFVAPLFPPPSCLSASTGGVSTATSGIVSSTRALFFRASNSVAIDCFRSAVVCGCSSSSILKLALRFVMLGSPLFSRFNPN